MSDQLHDLMTRIADRAGPAPHDPTLWDRARRARRDQRRLRVAAVAAAVAAVLATLTLAGVKESGRDAPPPVEQPHRSEGPGIPSTVYAVTGHGGLPLETDLAVGRASVALANSRGAFVVTADDGVYHRLRLPGYYPVRFSAGLTGLALSPDGRQLVWSWHNATRPGQDERLDAWGLRLADLTTGDVRTVWVADGSGLHSNPRWSADGRYVIADEVYGIGVGERWAPPAADAGYAIEYFGVVLDVRRMRRTSIAGSYLDGSPYDAWVVAPSRRAYRVVGDRLLTWVHVTGEPEWRRSPVTAGVSGLSTGRVSGDGRWLLLSGHDSATGVALVDLDAPGPGAPVARVETRTEIDVIGWTDDRHVLALEGPVEGDRALVRLAIEPAPADLASGATGSVQLDVEQLGSLVGAGEDTTVSIAVDLAAGERTTWDADTPPFADQAEVRQETASAARPPATASHDDGEPTGSRTALLLGLVGAAAVAALVLGALRVGRPRTGSSG
jgi:hypothetical protein